MQQVFAPIGPWFRGSRRLFLGLVLGLSCGQLTAPANENSETEPPPARATLALNLTKTGPTISKHIYGQFIEHLGRCIHDGIWAEKLRDRKFFLEPAKSPWQTVKPAEGAIEIFHDPAGAYAGDHGLALWLRAANSGGGGIQQGNLGVIAGQEYVGYAILANVTNASSVEVTLAWGDGANEAQRVRLTGLGAEYRKFLFRFRAGATTDSATLSLVLPQAGYLWIGCLSLMPADHVQGLRADVLELIRNLNPPITRWPGGNFVSGYHWKDGLGDRDRRPPRWERAWNDVEDNDFGIDEFLAFCAAVKTEPYIAVNSGLGSVPEVADEVEYVNGNARSHWGAERVRNGQARPYGVRWWGVGNEMYGDWQLGNVSIERYALRHNAFVTAMKARDPRIKIIAVGAPGRWNDVMLPGCAANMDLLSGHHYTERKLRVPFTPADEQVYTQKFLAYSDSVAAGIRQIVADFRNRLGKGDAALDRVRLAIDEWGIVRDWNSAPDGPGVGPFEHYYPLGDCLVLGRGLHELIRSADLVSMANWAQTVNVIGAIKTTRNYAAMDSAGHLLALYRAHCTGMLVPVSLNPIASVDAVASLNQRTGILSVGLINFSPHQSAALDLRPEGVTQFKSIQGWRINGPSLGALNVPGEPETVTTTPLNELLAPDKPVLLPAHSITLLSIKTETP